MGDIVERLKSQNELYVQKYVGTYDIDENKIEPLCEEAAAEITRLREENERLRKALKPFAAPVKDFRHSVPDRLVVEEEFTLGQLRAAAAAIREGGKDE